MGYGVEIDNGNGARQLDSNVVNSIAVITSGTISGGGTLTGVNLSTDLFFVNRSSTGMITLNKSGSDTSATITNNTSDSINYIRGKLASGIAPDGSGTYGVELYNASGQRTYSSNYGYESNILSIKPANSLTTGSDLGGGYSGLASGSENYTANKSLYASYPWGSSVPTNWYTAASYDGNPSSENDAGKLAYKFLWPRLIYSGNPANVYVFAPPWNYDSTSISGASGYRTGTTWDYSNNEIGFTSCFHSSFNVPFVGTYIWRVAPTNQCAIIIMKRKG